MAVVQLAILFSSPRRPASDIAHRPPPARIDAGVCPLVQGNPLPLTCRNAAHSTMSAHMRTCAVQLQAAPSRPANGVVGLRTRRRGQPAGARRSVAALARPERSVKDTVVAIWEGLGSMADFESWAPRSARAWRLREVRSPATLRSLYLMMTIVFIYSAGCRQPVASWC